MEAAVLAGKEVQHEVAAAQVLLDGETHAAHIHLAVQFVFQGDLCVGNEGVQADAACKIAGRVRVFEFR